ncbi:hypothetical protein Ga0466249_005166 [Sporomusaceae bacterium BoRhaA]|uniref:excisionase n=1 Tax=Pelorhabdus rhamnosifermentans TaxID=2772457 RepID=UPI001C06317F|nr:excisionase [Pelorhabdus rhamnosifermentans]MBU2704014.1 hypothetical protein [Pelorhabdus rhamnosifermentans]
MSSEKIMASVKEFAAMTGIGQNRVRELCYLPDFPASKEGNRFLIHVEAANEWLRKRAVDKVGVVSASLKRVVP